MVRVKEIWQQVYSFLRFGVWEVHCANLALPKRVGVYAIRLISLVVSGFKNDQCTLHAASLTFFSLMALIPVLALMLAMARSFGGADMAKEQFDKQLDGWMAQIEQPASEVLPEAEVAPQTQTTTTPPEEAVVADQDLVNSAAAFTSQVKKLSDNLFEQIEKLKFGTLGGIGAVMLVWMVIQTLGKVESSFNLVWGVEQARPLVRKCFDYLGVAMILPFLVTAASSVPVAAMITRFMDKTVGGGISDAVRMLLESGLFKFSVTMLIGTITFAFILGFMPNTRVRTVPALVGGGVTMLLFSVWLKLCAMMQIGIGKYSTLYGSFAVLPILLLWVYTSWQIILLGAEITFALQNRDTYVLEQNAAKASLRARLSLALILCSEAAREALGKPGGPFNAELFAQRHGISNRFTRDILEELVRNEILAPVADRPGEYLLRRCGSSITTGEIVGVILDDGKPLEALGVGRLSEPVAEFNRVFDERVVGSFADSIARL